MESQASPGTLPQLLESWTALFGDLLAIAGAGEVATFAQLDARSAEFASRLLAAGVAKGARVAILMPNGPEYLVSLIGAWRIGAVAVLVSTLSRPPELARVLRHADVDLLVTVDCYLRNDYIDLLEQAVPELAGQRAERRIIAESMPFLRAVWFRGELCPAWGTRDGAIDGVPAGLVKAAQHEVVAADPALIICTSGSSGQPKAIVHSQGNLVRQGEALAALMSGCGPGDRLLSTMPFFWVGGLCTVVLAALCSGTAVLCPEDPGHDATVACAREFSATHIMHWPAQLDLMKHDPEFAALLARMRPAYAHQLQLFGEAPAELNPNTLGMTETLGPHSMCPMAALPPAKAGSFGLAVGGIERRIIDPETGTELPAGTPGQLCLRGGALLTGMHRRSHDEVFDGQGFYRTDDIARIDEDGHLFFVGRSSDILKISGANVSPVEVEAAIRQLPGVKGGWVAGVIPEGATETVLAAALVPVEGAVLDVPAIRAALKQQVSSYKVPRHFVVVAEADLPMSATSKILRSELGQLLKHRITAAIQA